MTAPILVTGATGNVGREVVTQLLDAGVPVRALVRNVDKAKSILDPRAELVVGDFDNVASLDSAVQGVEKVFLLSAGDLRQAEQQGNVIEAAKRAGVKHIVKLSALGSDQEFGMFLMGEHKKTEQQLAQSGMAYTILRPNSFMQNTIAFFAQSIAWQGVFGQSVQADTKVSHVDTRDIAAVAVAAFTQPGHEGKAYEIVGPEALSFNEIAEKFSKALDKPVTYNYMPPAAFKEMMLGYGLEGWLLDDLNKLAEFYNAGGASVTNDVVSKTTGKAPRTFDQFLREHLDAFKQK